jgi:TrpR-related protein YerC/YecD
MENPMNPGRKIAAPMDEASSHPQHLKDLFEALRLLKTEDEYQRFFDDLCTPAELRSLADRWRVAQLLEKGIPYRSISEETGVSTATITRVARCLIYGAKGYRTILDRLKKGRRL